MDSKSLPKFYSLSIKEGQPQKVTVPRTAYLTITNVSFVINPAKQTAPVRLFALCSKHSKKSQVPALLASLYPQQIEQVTVNLRLSPAEVAEFSVKGPHQVDVIGYLAPPDFDEEESDFDDDDYADYDDDGDEQ